MILDHHPADSRTDIADDQNTIQTLTSRMGTGGGNVPLIAEPITYDAQVTNPLHKDNTQGGVCHTLNNDSRNYVVIPIEGNGTRPSHFGNGYRDGGAMYSLNTTEVHAVAYGFEPGILKREGKASRVCEEVSPTLRNNMGDNQTAVAYTLKIRGGVRHTKPGAERLRKQGKDH